MKNPDGAADPIRRVSDEPAALVAMDGATGTTCRMTDLRIDGYAGAVAVLASSAVSFAVFDAAEILMAASGRLATAGGAARRILYPR